MLYWIISFPLKPFCWTFLLYLPRFCYFYINIWYFFCQTAEISWVADPFSNWMIFLDNQIFWSAGRLMRLIKWEVCGSRRLLVNFEKYWPESCSKILNWTTGTLFMHCLCIICSLVGFASLGHLRIWDICVFGTSSRRAPQASGKSNKVICQHF